MAIRTIREVGDPILRKISKPVQEMTPRTQQLIDDMIESMQEADGVGLAAVQVGVLKRLAVVCVPEPAEDEEEEAPELGTNGTNEEFESDTLSQEELDMTHSFGQPIVMINPTWEAVGEQTQTGNEGCLSVPGKYGEVTRPDHLILKAYDENMEPYELEAMGLLARAICHECDHLDGILYIDKVEGEIKDNGSDEEE